MIQIKEIDRTVVALSLVLFLLSVAISGAITTNYLQNSEDAENELYQESFNVEANPENVTAHIQFDGNGSVGINLEQLTDETRLFIDLNGDGSYSTEQESLNRDGEVTTFSREVVQQDKMYQILFSYKISEEETWFRIDEVREI